MEVYIDNRQEEVDLDETIYVDIEKLVEEALLFEKGDSSYEVSISFVSEKEMRELNREYRNINQVTDVLSFPIEDDFIVPLPLLGDIIIAPKRAQEQAIEYGHSLEREILYLSLHSIFHLLGYDHIEEEDKKLMREREKEIISRLDFFKRE